MPAPSSRRLDSEGINLLTSLLLVSVPAAGPGTGSQRQLEPTTHPGPAPTSVLTRSHLRTVPSWPLSTPHPPTQAQEKHNFPADLEWGALRTKTQFKLTEWLCGLGKLRTFSVLQSPPRKVQSVIHVL